jgi:phospholipid/cholesterol/gamma-HCH transport system ATP-binding protein
MGGGPIIEVRGLKTRFGDKWVHKGIDLEEKRGEVLAVIGGSGSGKTTLLQQILGLITPDAGLIRVFEKDVHHQSVEDARHLRHHWGVLFQQGALFSALNVFDNVAFPLRELRKDGEEIDEGMVRELVQLKLEIVGLDADDALKQPAELSGGMVKRAALARALILEAELLLLDEPTTGLDPISATEFEDLLIELRKELGFTVFMITHDLKTLAALSDRIAILHDGKIAASGTLEEVAESADPYVRRFFHRRRGEEALRSLPSY